MKYERDRREKQPSLAHIYFIYSYILQFQSDYYLDHKRKVRSFLPSAPLFYNWSSDYINIIAIKMVNNIVNTISGN